MKWPKINKVGLAEYITADAINQVKLPVSRYDLLQTTEGLRAIANAIYDAAAQHGTHYAFERYDPQSAIQLIRDPEEVLVAPGEGTCLDLAVLFCGLCLGFELLPLIIVLDGHALAAVSVRHDLRQWDDFGRTEHNLFEAGPLEDADELRRLVDEGRYVAVECTGFARSKSLSPAWPEGAGRTAEGLLSFPQAVAAGRQQLDRPDRPLQFAIDVAIARRAWGVESLLRRLREANQAGRVVGKHDLATDLIVLSDERPLEQLANSLAEDHGITDSVVRHPGQVELAAHVDEQIGNVLDAASAVGSEPGIASPEAEYQLGMLAASRRDYGVALGHLRNATLEPSDDIRPNTAIAWLQQSLAHSELSAGRFATARERLDEATAALDRVESPAAVLDDLRGYVAKSRAQIAEATGDIRARDANYSEAANRFGAALARQPRDASAWNGLGNVRSARGELDGAITSYQQAIKLQQNYTAAYHDLALAYRDKAGIEGMKISTAAKQRFRFQQAAARSMRTARRLAETDPGFTAEYLPVMDRFITKLESAGTSHALHGVEPPTVVH